MARYSIQTNDRSRAKFFRWMDPVAKNPRATHLQVLLENVSRWPLMQIPNEAKLRPDGETGQASCVLFRNREILISRTRGSGPKNRNSNALEKMTTF